MSEVRYIGIVETAKIMRAALRLSFADTKFSVRTYHGQYARCTVRWVEGPPESEVLLIADQFWQHSVQNWNGQLVEFAGARPTLERWRARQVIGEGVSKTA